jgi:hypothetical protein
MFMKRSFWIPSFLLGLVMAMTALPASAVFLTCSDICKCTVACSHPCREYENGPLLHCSDTGDCAGGSGCVIASAESAIFAAEEPTTCSAEPASAAPAEPAR